MKTPFLNRLIFFLCFGATLLFFGLKDDSEKLQHAEKNIFSQDDPKLIFKKIEEGFNQNDIKMFDELFGKQIYLSLFNGVSGYYTSNQAFYVLKDFMNITRPEKFSFSKIHDGESPYATGEFNFTSAGKRGKAKIYISLSAWGQAWRISQITIR